MLSLGNLECIRAWWSPYIEHHYSYKHYTPSPTPNSQVLRSCSLFLHLHLQLQGTKASKMFKSFLKVVQRCTGDQATGVQQPSGAVVTATATATPPDAKAAALAVADAAGAAAAAAKAKVEAATKPKTAAELAGLPVAMLVTQAKSTALAAALVAATATATVKAAAKAVAEAKAPNKATVTVPQHVVNGPSAHDSKDDVVEYVGATAVSNSTPSLTSKASDSSSPASDDSLVRPADDSESTADDAESTAQDSTSSVDDTKDKAKGQSESQSESESKSDDDDDRVDELQLSIWDEEDKQCIEKGEHPIHTAKIAFYRAKFDRRALREATANGFKCKKLVDQVENLKKEGLGMFAKAAAKTAREREEAAIKLENDLAAKHQEYTDKDKGAHPLYENKRSALRPVGGTPAQRATTDAGVPLEAVLSVPAPTVAAVQASDTGSARPENGNNGNESNANDNANATDNDDDDSKKALVERELLQRCEILGRADVAVVDTVTVAGTATATATNTTATTTDAVVPVARVAEPVHSVPAPTVAAVQASNTGRARPKNGNNTNNATDDDPNQTLFERQLLQRCKNLRPVAVVATARRPLHSELLNARKTLRHVAPLEAPLVHKPTGSSGGALGDETLVRHAAQSLPVTRLNAPSVCGLALNVPCMGAWAPESNADIEDAEWDLPTRSDRGVAAPRSVADRAKDVSVAARSEAAHELATPQGAGEGSEVAAVAVAVDVDVAVDGSEARARAESMALLRAKLGERRRAVMGGGDDDDDEDDDESFGGGRGAKKPATQQGARVGSEVAAVAAVAVDRSEARASAESMALLRAKLGERRKAVVGGDEDDDDDDDESCTRGRSAKEDWED